MHAVPCCAPARVVRRQQSRCSSSSALRHPSADLPATLPCCRPTEYKVGDLGPGAASLQPEMSPCTLYLGGDVGPESVHLLHGVRGLQQSAEVIPGVFVSAACIQYVPAAACC